jgi:transcriptional regulator
MYIPKSFEVTEREALVNFIEQNSFGILFSEVDQQPFATHLPFLIDEHRGQQGILFGHMAKANPHWRELDGKGVLVVFPGPHAYISPAWYQTAETVPTWNYVAVHVYGKFQVVDNAEGLERIMRDSLNFFEPNSPIEGQVQDDFFQNKLKAIVGFHIEIEKIEGKWKLNQNHPLERQQRVIDALKKNPDDNSQEIARLMERNICQDTPSS